MKDSQIQTDYDFIVSKIGYVIERKPNPEWSITNLANNSYYILAYATEGQAHYYFNNNHYVVNKGDLLFFSKGLVHSASSSLLNPWGFSSVAFDLYFLNPNGQDKLLSIADTIITFNSYELSSLFSELNRIWIGKNPGYMIRCRSIIMNILYLMIQKMDSSFNNIPHFHAIKDILNMIQENYQKNFSIEELTQYSGLSPSYFRRLFKKATGLTPLQYQNYIKINKAKDLLLSGECNVSEAAFSVGFDNVHYFSRIFKKIAGVNPSHYLKR